ncbi:hypothetical protein GPA10_37005 [Streptomyces sp. p1417]|uniref:STAS domain-containing protein n=1 Tax=Streptomyces typhae TaxID=2681492 RepID=A0A6L6X8R7_9ACTN|nr:hypothetical protein [Streptomyces typhae]MVO90206.1 hypothetical protein [Streptomyces typhae]
MRTYFADELLLMLPLTDGPGVRLFGEILGIHRGPLALAVTEEADRTDEIVVDLTETRFLAHSVLDILIILAQRLTPPQHLVIRAPADLNLHTRLAGRGADRLTTLHLQES